ncbi:MAG: hypothetical protein QXP81_09365 [Nitrososphaerota archaeon]
MSLPPGLPRAPTIAVIRVSSRSATLVEKYLSLIDELARRHAVNAVRRVPYRTIFFRKTAEFLYGRDIEEFFRKSRAVGVVHAMGGAGGMNDFINELTKLAKAAAMEGVTIRIYMRPKITDNWIVLEVEAPTAGVLIDAISEIKEGIARTGLRATERYRPAVLGEPRTAAIRIRIPTPEYTKEVINIINEVLAKYGRKGFRIRSARTLYGPPPKFALAD